MKMQRLKHFIEETSFPLFKTLENNKQCATFDNKGFEFSEPALKIYNIIKSQPHLYVAYGNGFSYVGKSFQRNGRWQLSHYYHLGTLAHELIPGSLKNAEQRHNHWIDAWMIRDTLKITQTHYLIQLRDEIKISFIPFTHYGGEISYDMLCKQEIRKINKIKEEELIRFLSNEGEQLLNIQNNR